jgi:ATP-dependent DNA ligase
MDYDKEITINVVTGFDDKFRAQVWADVSNQPISWQKKVKKEWINMIEHPTNENIVGKTVEVLADAVSQNQDGTYSLRFPRFLRFREDK